MSEKVKLYLLLEDDGRQKLKEFYPRKGFDEDEKRLFASGADIVEVLFDVGIYEKFKKIKDTAIIPPVLNTAPTRIIEYESINSEELKYE